MALVDKFFPVSAGVSGWETYDPDLATLQGVGLGFDCEQY
jgi:hypothetical protein